MGVYKMTDDNQHRGSSNNMRETELVLPPGQFAYVLDETKGDVSVYCGPTKASLSTTDSPVLFESATGRFTKCDINSAQQINITAKQGEYIIRREMESVQIQANPSGLLLIYLM